MFSNDDPAREILVQVIKAQADAVRMMAAANHVLLEQAKRQLDERPNGTIGSLRGTKSSSLGGSSEQKTPGPPRLYTPQDKELRTWDGFRLRMQKLEQAVRRNLVLPPGARVSPEMICREGGPSAKTIGRIMVDRYGLKADQWPPSTWPAELPDCAEDRS